MKLEGLVWERDAALLATRWSCTVCGWKVEISDQIVVSSTIPNMKAYLEAHKITEEELALRILAHDPPPHYHLVK